MSLQHAFIGVTGRVRGRPSSQLPGSMERPTSGRKSVAAQHGTGGSGQNQGVWRCSLPCMLPKQVALLPLCGRAHFENDVLLESCLGAGNGGPCCCIVSILQSQHLKQRAALTTGRVQPTQLEVLTARCHLSPGLRCDMQGMISAHSRWLAFLHKQNFEPGLLQYSYRGRTQCHTLFQIRYLLWHTCT